MNHTEFSALCLARYGAGWQTQLARQLGVNARTVRRWASGESEVPGTVAAAVGARPAIALEYPDEWILGSCGAADAEDREYIVHLHTPRFVGIIADADAISGGTNLSLRHETIVDITWIDPPPNDQNMKTLLRSLQAFIDAES